MNKVDNDLNGENRFREKEENDLRSNSGVFRKSIRDLDGANGSLERKKMRKERIRNCVASLCKISECFVNDVGQATGNAIRAFKKDSASQGFGFEKVFDDYQERVNEIFQKVSMFIHLCRNKMCNNTFKEELDKKLNILNEIYNQEELEKSKNIVYSSYAKSALSLANGINFEKLERLNELGDENLKIFKVFFQFLQKPLPNESDNAWKVVISYLHSLKNITSTRESVSQKIMKEIDKFDYSDENLEKLEQILPEKRLDYNQEPEQSYLLTPFYYIIKESCLYGGLIEGRVPIFRQYSRLNYKLQILNRLNN